MQVGKLADLVIWKPAFFGAKPEMVLKGGTIAWSDMGDPNASIPTPEPVIQIKFFDSFSVQLKFLIPQCVHPSIHPFVTLGDDEADVWSFWQGRECQFHCFC